MGVNKMERIKSRDLIINHYNNPRCYGELSKAVTFEGSIPGYDNYIKIYAQCEQGIVHCKFKGRGSTLFIAAASLLMEEVSGKTIEEARSIDINFLVNLLGKSTIYNRIACSTLALKTLKKVLQLVDDQRKDKS